MTTTENIIYLIQCSLSEKKPDENLLTQANFSQIFKICQKHKIAALTDISVQKLGSDIISDDMKKKFRNRTLNTQRTNILFEAEKENIRKRFCCKEQKSKAGIYNLAQLQH